MSDDLIRRRDAIGACAYETIECYEARKAIRALPSADRPQGEWIDKGDYAVCSHCGAHSGTQNDGVEFIPLKTNFCSNCGAKMKGADDD